MLKNPSESQRSLCKALGVPLSNRDVIRQIKADLGYLENSTQNPGAPELGESHSYSGDVWDISIPKTRICTLDQLLEHCRVDTSIWEVERFVVNKWEMGSVPRMGEGVTGEPVVTPLFQVKATLKRNLEKVAIHEEIAALKEDVKGALKRPVAPPKKVKQSSLSGVMVEISIPDLHVGKLAWARETGYTNYDHRIAQDLFIDAVEKLIERTHWHNPEEIIFVIGNDLLNADNVANTTTKGTPQHNDSRYHKTFRSTRIMLTEAMRRLRGVCPVKIITVPGNHDTLSAWHMGDSLECLYSGQPDITFDNEPTSRKYHQWGRVMLGFTHGDKGKHDDYPLLFASERPKMFGATSWREIHVGHLHQTKVREKNGIKVRILPALCAPEEWHSSNGYVGNIRSAEAFIWSKDELLGTAIYTASDYAERVGEVEH